jgi:hypothetical protein
MTSSRFRRIFLLGLLTAQLFAAAKPKAASPPTPDPATTVPPQVYGLDDVPSTIIQALPNLLKKGDMEPRLIWYKTEKAKTSATAAVILVPMACKDEPDDWKSVERRFWNGRKNYDSKYGMDKGTLDPDFAMACGKTPMGDKVKFLTPSLPSQNKNPLKAGDGIIAAIYDRDSLIKSANPDYIGFSVQSVNANPLNPAPLRQTQPAANPEIPSKETPPTRHFYYLVWNGNPVVGDTTLTISVTLINPVASSPDRVQLGNGDTGRPNPVGVPGPASGPGTPSPVSPPVPPNPGSVTSTAPVDPPHASPQGADSVAAQAVAAAQQAAAAAQQAAAAAQQIAVAAAAQVSQPPTPQTQSLVSSMMPQSHNPSYYNVAYGFIASSLRSPSWSRLESAPGVSCPAGTPQPCIPTPELYQTVQNPEAARTVAPVLFFTIYPKPLDAERKWRLMDLIPAPSVGLSLTSPSTDFFAGFSFEVRRGVQLVAGRHIGKVNELSPTIINDPTSSVAPVTIQRFHPGWFGGVTFNFNFLQSLFKAGGQ